MTGTLISKRRRAAVLLFPLLGLATAASVRADDLHLTGDARLTGTVSAILEDGSIELVSPLAPEPVRLVAEAVEKVRFGSPSVFPTLPVSQIELINGDLLPATVESLDADTLAVFSPVAGRLDIPRNVVKSLHFGIVPERRLYSGPEDLEGWANDAGNRNTWTHERNALEIMGTGRISREFPALEQFIVRFSLKWKNNPNFQFFFADPLKPYGEPADRYFFQFNTAGMELKREADGRRRHATLVQIPRQPAQFAGRLDVEIRVDRREQVLHLFINGLPEGSHPDPIPGAPTGGGIMLVSSAPNNTEQSVSGIEILHWDAAGDRHRTEERGNPAVDTLISSHGDRMEGRLLEVRPGPAGQSFVFKSDFLEAPAELDEAEISTLFFAEGEGSLARDDAHPFSLRLHGKGFLQVASCTFSGDNVEVSHPLLGRLSLLRDGVSTLERSPAKPQAVPAP